MLVIFSEHENISNDEPLLIKLTKSVYLNCYQSSVTHLNTRRLHSVLLLVVKGSSITSLDLRPMKNLEGMLAGGSQLKKLIAGVSTKLKLVDVDDTFIGVTPVESMPLLNLLYIQGSKIEHMDLRNNSKLKKVYFSH